MTYKTSFSAELVIPHAAQEIEAVLCDAQSLPLWNPAFSSVGQPGSDGVFPLIVQRFLPGSLRYTSRSGEIALTVKIPD